MLSSTADAAPPEPAFGKAEAKEAQKLFTPALRQLLRRAFTPKGMEFFDFYVLLKRIQLGDIAPEDIRLRFKRAINRLFQVTSPVDGKPLSPFIVNMMAEARPDINLYLGRLLLGHREPSLWRRLNNILVPFIVQAARDKGVYINYRQVGQEQWPVFRKMNPRQERNEKLRDNDPEGYALMQRYRKSLADIDRTIATRVRRGGREVQKGMLLGRPVTYGIDPKTGEKFVYDRDGEVLPVDRYIAKRREQLDAKRRASKVPSRTEVPLSDLRALTDEELDVLPGPTEMAALTDDRAKQGRLTRIFPTRRREFLIEGTTPEEDRIEEQQVIVGGRFKGVLLDDMVNSEGRLIEGTAYSYNPSADRSERVPVRIDPGEREPYVSAADVVAHKQVRGRKVRVKERKLFLKVPGTHPYTELRKAMKKLACNVGAKRGCVPSISFEPTEGSRAASFYFDPKDFGAVMDTLQGMSLSAAALQMVRDYYKELAVAELATAEENLGAYTAETIGGFVKNKKNSDTGEMEPFRLLTKQKQAMAWLDANGGRGVCALDTGIGKTVLALASMQKLVRDGMVDEGASYTRPSGKEVKTNGRFLYVCPNSLRGNLKKEARAFITDDRTFMSRVDVISYDEFGRSSKSRKVPGSIKSVRFWKGRKWDAALYVAVYFDEAHKLKNPDSERSKAALKLWHPRKICLTASPMEKRPMEAYVLAAISNNTPLVGRTTVAQKNRKEMRRFKERFCEVIGGRIMGVKQDPLIKRDLQTWVKRNIFYADKQDVEEFELPQLDAQTVAVQMPPAAEKVYRGITSQFSALMGGLVAKFRDRGLNEEGPNARDRSLERVFGLAFRPLVRMLTEMANYPDVALLDIATMLETGEMPYTTTGGEPIPVPKVLQWTLAQWRAEGLEPEALREAAAAAGNPKLEQAETVIRQKSERTKGASRTILFTDDKRFCMMSARRMAQRISGKHAVALNDSILILEGDSPMPEVAFEIDPEVLRKLVKDPAEQERILRETKGTSRIRLPFTKRALRKHPELPADDTLNPHYQKADWQQFVMKEVIGPNPDIKTLTLHGPTYQYGHNLQDFDTVVHLDRDSWNSESMKQRTARVWRQGQGQPVDEITIDATYSPSPGGEERDYADHTLDEIRRFFQEVDGAIFDRIIKDAQGVELGKEWAELAQRDSSLLHLDQKVLELMTSPYAERSTPPGG